MRFVDKTTETQVFCLLTAHSVHDITKGESGERKVDRGRSMNIQNKDILKMILSKKYTSQRALATETGYSLGTINKSIKSLIAEGYIDEEMNPTEKAVDMSRKHVPKSAIILAAGYGMRMVPINTECPKALLEVCGETLIERIIRQLHEVDINDVYVVVGFMKERFEYLIDEYGVKLIVNSEYAGKNNLHSLRKAVSYLPNAYVIPGDIWCADNPFSKYELYSWYMVSDKLSEDSDIRVNRKMELAVIPEKTGGNSMVGISYILEQDAPVLCEEIEKLCQNSKYDNAFWEQALYHNDKMRIQAKLVSHKKVVEINTYEQLRELDGKSNQLKSDAIDVISKVLNIDSKDIIDISVLKKGMTNRSFLFSCKSKRYIMRIPGEGTDKLINRKEEAAVYQCISDKKICDDIKYINPENGFKITEYLDGARVCDAFNQDDVRMCMKKLRRFHESKLKVEHEFDIFSKIDFYESLWGDVPSIYRDYSATKENVFKLKKYIDKYAGEKILTHIDAVPDNFLFVKNEKGEDEIRLIDWEYAGMQDPHVDIAMFCIYALYDKEQVDELIDAYFDEGCSQSIRTKIYCYIAACGLLWSNWCEYKRNLGVEFGEYSLRQYRYAKDYYRIVADEISKMEE